MSTTAAKRRASQARADARDLLRLIAGDGQWQDYAERWELAGSLRRNRELVGDVEHVVIPRMGEVTKPGTNTLFNLPERGNVLWARLDELVAEREIGRWYNGRSETWGERYRRVGFRGFCHEFFTADADNWGSVMLIRTGPAEFSKGWVTALQTRGLKHVGGRVIRSGWVRCINCDWQGHAEDLADSCGDSHCPACSAAGASAWPAVVVPTPDEDTAFGLAGFEFIEPSRRVVGGAA